MIEPNASSSKEIPAAGKRRVVVEGVSPEIDCGRYPAKRVVGERMTVEADVFTDGHDAIACVLLHRGPDHGSSDGSSDEEWREVPMEPLGNDRWRASFPLTSEGLWSYTVEGWIDHFESWRRDLAKRLAAGQDVTVDLQVGANLLRDTASRAPAKDRKLLETLADSIEEGGDEDSTLALDPEMAALARRHADRSGATRYARELELRVDRERARFSTWYEMFPRSAGEGTEHGTFRDVEERLGYVADMGFDVLYLPPIHPIGETHRKGKNNARTAEPGDVGSPWAIGSSEGGHKSIHPDLGTPEDFRHLVEAAREKGIEIALDVAFQCSPDHPYVHEHPEWFKKRPDGTIQYAENPPKKYEDIVPFDFECEDWQALWEELLSVFLHWIGEGVKIFRVDNPHTKPFRFWEWVIGRIEAEHPDVLFLAEAFTRPKVMYRLAKLGFTQSYNYFPWRNTRWELTEYLTELTRTEVVEYFRPNLWPNTPDILTERLQIGGRAAFVQRLILAATLGASYGIYGPAFELQESKPREPESEEYLDSEKYEIRDWDLERPDSLAELVGRVNRIRREHPALQQNRTLVFHPTDNDQLLCYSKRVGADVILVVVDMDPHHRQSGWTDLRLDELGVDHDRPYQVHDLITGARFLWQGAHNYVELEPHAIPAHIFRIRKQVRSEEDFDYFA